MPNHIQFTHVLQLDSLARLKNSRNGNPRYLVAFTNGLVGKTKPDSSMAYAIHSGLSFVTVKYHFTPKGHCVIDDIS